MTIAELYAQLTELLAQAQALAEQAAESEAGLTEENEREIDAIRAKAAEVRAQIARAERAEAIVTELRAEQANLTAPAGRRSAPLGAHSHERGTINFDAMRSYGTIPNFRRVYEGLPMPEVRELAFRAGQFLLARFWGNKRAAAWCAEHGVGNREDRDLTGASGVGAYLVPDEMSNVLISIREEFGVFRKSIGRVWPMASDKLLVPTRTAGLTVYFPAQNQAITGSDLTFGQAELSAIKMAAMSKFPTELAEDAVIDLAELVTAELGYAIANAEDLCGFVGDGTATYGTITGLIPALVAVTNNKSVKTAATAHDTVAELDAADVRLLITAVPRYAGLKPAWYCSQGVADEVFGRLLEGGGGNTMNDLSSGHEMRYAGYPIIPTEAMKGTDASAGDPVIAFGDLSMAVAMGNRRDFAVSFTDQRYWTEDQVALKATQRIAVKVHTPGTSSKAGPVAVLKLGAGS